MDPPFPKISVDKIIDFLKDDMLLLKKYNPGIELGKAFPGQQSSYYENKQNIMFLKKLSGK